MDHGRTPNGIGHLMIFYILKFGVRQPDLGTQTTATNWQYRKCPKESDQIITRVRELMLWKQVKKTQSPNTNLQKIKGWLNPLLAARFVWHRLAAAKITLAQATAAATISSQQHHLQATLFPPKHTVSRRFVNKFMSHKDAFSEDHEILCQHQEVLG